MGKADLKEFLAGVGRGAQELRRAIGGFLAQAGDEIFALRGAIVKPQETEEPQVKAQQPAFGQGGETLGGEAFIIGGGILSLELPPRAVGKGFAHDPHPSGEHEARLGLERLRLFPERCEGRALPHSDPGKVGADSRPPLQPG
jgi:hypothetical protein